MTTQHEDMPDVAWLKKQTRADGGMYWLKSTGKDGLKHYTRTDSLESVREALDIAVDCIEAYQAAGVIGKGLKITKLKQALETLNRLIGDA